MVKNIITLEISGFADSIKDQLSKQEFTAKQDKIETWEKIKESILMLYFHSYITDDQKTKMCKKLFNDIKKNVKTA